MVPKSPRCGHDSSWARCGAWTPRSRRATRCAPASLRHYAAPHLHRDPGHASLVRYSWRAQDGGSYSSRRLGSLRVQDPHGREAHVGGVLRGVPPVPRTSTPTDSGTQDPPSRGRAQAENQTAFCTRTLLRLGMSPLEWKRPRSNRSQSHPLLRWSRSSSPRGRTSDDVLERGMSVWVSAVRREPAWRLEGCRPAARCLVDRGDRGRRLASMVSPRPGRHHLPGAGHQQAGAQAAVGDPVPNRQTGPGTEGPRPGHGTQRGGRSQHPLRATRGIDGQTAAGLSGQ